MKGIKLLLILSASLSSILFCTELQIVNLKVEYETTPLGIDVEYPRFSWQMKASNNQPGCKQSAYQLQVTDESGNLVWNSGEIKSNVSLNIEYGGKPLDAITRYNWIVDVWDQNNNKHTANSWFETGLMTPGPGQYTSSWSGAKWIGGSDEDMVLFSQYLPVFKINYTIQLDKVSDATKAAFVYGANDIRLMDRNKNLLQLENKNDSSYFMIEIDIAPLSLNENALLNIYRVGYHPNDKKEVPFKSYPIPDTIINNKNKHEKHTISLKSNLGDTRIYIDGKEEGNRIAAVNLNPLGRGGDFIAFPVVADIGFSVPKGQLASFTNVEICNFRSPSNILFTEKLDEQTYNGIFSGLTGNFTVKQNAYIIKGGKSGTFIVANPSKNSMPMLRTTFFSRPTITKARLYVTSRGIYEIYLNGKRVGNDYFNPGLTQYNKTHLYQTYDVTEYIQSGENAIGALLGEGWWSGGTTFTGEFWNYFGDRQSLLTKLVITYSDEKEDIIVSDPETWYYFNEGPVVYGSFFQGEVYDASKDSLIEGWSTSFYDASKWKQAEEISLKDHINLEGLPNIQEVDNYSEVSLIGQFGETVKKIKELTALSVEEVRPGVFVYDMGQNIVGVPKISLTGMVPGEEIFLRFAEVKYPNLPEYKENAGMIMLENIRAAMAQDIYITKGGNEIIHPRFTYHGYRFLEITGIEKPLPLKDVKGTILSSVHQLASYYETSNPLVNRLWENITWSTFGNFLSIPTDCPQRNERLGWSGDISVFSRTATYLADFPQFLRRHMLAMRDLQREDGRFSDVAPLGVGFGGILWGSAGITVPWECYRMYQDITLLDEHYNAMKKYIEFLIQDINPQTGILKEDERKQWSSLGDWLSPEDHKNEKTLLWEAYFIYDLELMSKVASILDKKEDKEWYKKFCTERKEFFNKTYFNNETGKTVYRGKIVDTQTSYVLPLAFNIFNEKNKEAAIKNFAETITREHETDKGVLCPPYSLMTGFIGTAWINIALSQSGLIDMAYRLFQQTSYPSWLYPVEQGATTIWERLNSYTHTDGFGGNNRMNSFNHYSFGAIGAWMYSYSLGIQPDETSPGFKHFILQPEPDPTREMTYARGHYESMYGLIESGWEIQSDIVKYHFIVPANTTATLYLNAPSVNTIMQQGKSLKITKGVKYIGKNNEKHVFELISGEYKIQIGTRAFTIKID